MTKVILFNGAPRSGKDTAAALTRELIREQGLRSMGYKFAQPLKDAVHALYGLSVVHDYFEDTKDVPNEIFGGLSPREAYISLSENYVKLKLSKDFFGRAAVNCFKQDETKGNYDVVIISDLGFTDELGPIVEHFGAENCSIIQMFREGCTFDNDSRSYVSGYAWGDLHLFRVGNNGSIDDLKPQLKAIVDLVLP